MFGVITLVAVSALLGSALGENLVDRIKQFLIILALGGVAASSLVVSGSLNGEVPEDTVSGAAFGGVALLVVVFTALFVVVTIKSRRSSR